ncbi:MAG: hypothetical protein RLZZ133_394 [Pseudomonadota bacterium]|jgi:hypothetical protein
MRQQSVIVGLFSLGLGLLLHFWLIPNFISVPSNMARLVLSPAFWPEILAGMAMLAGVFVLVGAFRQPAKPNSQDLAPLLTIPEDQQASNDSPPLQEVSEPSLVRLLAFVTAMALYAKYLEYLGMALASILMLLISFYLLGEKRIGLVLSVSILLPLVLYAFFLHVAGVSIPQGELIALP